MSDEAVELSVAGTKVRVVSTAGQQELQALVAMVEEKLASIVKAGRPVTKEAMVLAAISLANDATEARLGDANDRYQ